MTGDGMLKGKTVLVTGGSRGIGRATVETMHREGAHVVLHYSSGAGEAQAIQQQLGDRIRLVQGNLAEPGHAQAVWAAAEEWNGRVDVLVNNAGAWLASPLDDPAGWAEGWEANYKLNLLAPADLCREAILGFRKRGGGIIVNVTSPPWRRRRTPRLRRCEGRAACPHKGNSPRLRQGQHPRLRGRARLGGY